MFGNTTGELQQRVGLKECVWEYSSDRFGLVVDDLPFYHNKIMNLENNERMVI